MLKNAYLQRVYDQVLARDPNAPEFHQCIREFLESLEGIVDKHPEWERNAILERFVEPDRIITFRHRPLQGRTALPSVGQPLGHEVPRL